MRAVVVVGIAVLFSVGCGSNPVSPPSATAPPATPPASSPAATLACAQTTLSIYSEGGDGTLCKLSTNGADVTQSAQWTSSNAAVAAVSSSGFVQAKGIGTVRISANAQGATASQAITVGDNFPLSVFSATGTAVEGATPVWLKIPNGAPGGNHPTVSIDWGDGQTSSAPAGNSALSGCYILDSCIYLQHLYSNAGVYTTTATADVSSPPRPVRTSVTIKTLTGTWTNTYQNPSTGRETRLLILSGAASLSGTYIHPAGDGEPLSGSVDSSGFVHAKLNSGTISWDSDGLHAFGVTSDVSAFTVVEKGGSADGVTLTFTRQQ